MEFTYLSLNSLPIIQIDSFYQQCEVEKINKELCFLNNNTSKLLSPEFTDSATIVENNNPVLLKKNKGIILDDVYKMRAISDILTLNRKLFSQELVEILANFHYFFNYIKMSNIDYTLVQYYENSDYYQTHADNAIITAVQWFYQPPKSFEGGNFLIEDKLHIECLPNRCVIFPSVLRHSVSEVSTPENLIGKNLGRYSITQLLGIH